MPTKLFVANFPDSTRAADLEKLFKNYGDVVECIIPFPNVDFAFVHMARDNEATDAIANLGGHRLGSKRLVVELSTATTQGRQKQRNDNGTPARPADNSSARRSSSAGTSKSAVATTTPLARTAVNKQSSENPKNLASTQHVGSYASALESGSVKAPGNGEELPPAEEQNSLTVRKRTKLSKASGSVTTTSDNATPARQADYSSARRSSSAGSSKSAVATHGSQRARTDANKPSSGKSEDVAVASSKSVISYASALESGSVKTPGNGGKLLLAEEQKSQTVRKLTKLSKTKGSVTTTSDNGTPARPADNSSARRSSSAVATTTPLARTAVNKQSTGKPKNLASTQNVGSYASALESGSVKTPGNGGELPPAEEQKSQTVRKLTKLSKSSVSVTTTSDNGTPARPDDYSSARRSSSAGTNKSATTTPLARTAAKKQSSGKPKDVASSQHVGSYASALESGSVKAPGNGGELPPAEEQKSQTVRKLSKLSNENGSVTTKIGKRLKKLSARCPETESPPAVNTNYDTESPKNDNNSDTAAQLPEPCDAAAAITEPRQESADAAYVSADVFANRQHYPSHNIWHPCVADMSTYYAPEIRSSYELPLNTNIYVPNYAEPYIMHILPAATYGGEETRHIDGYFSRFKEEEVDAIENEAAMEPRFNFVEHVEKMLASYNNPDGIYTLF